MEEKQKKKGGFGKILLGILAVLGVLFIIIMIIPDDEESAETEKPREEANVDDEGSGPDIPDPKATDVSLETDDKSATVMIYINGSDLESEYGEASTDISEMLSSGIGKNVNVVIQTMGTKKWAKEHGISSKTAQTWIIKNKKLKKVRDNLGQLDCTKAGTLSDFISYSKKKYPAERYIFIFWDHGGGPVYGFGYDEWQSEGASLTIAEMAKAFEKNKDIHFDIIGMDCCIMASMETCYALAPYCKYTLLSEDFESGLGWSYKSWMKKLEKNPGISTPLLGKCIVDDIIKDNENEEWGDSACISLFNESTIKNLYKAWKAYAYKNESALLNKNYSKKHRAKGRGSRAEEDDGWDWLWDMIDEWASDSSDVTLSDYYISDILALVENIDPDSNEAKNLKSALKAAVAYYGHTSDKNELTGLAVSLPYGDSEFYGQLSDVYSDIGLDDEYIDWLGEFVSSDGSNDYYNYDDFEDSWGGWEDYEADYGSNTSDGSSEYCYDYDTGDYYGYEDEWSDDGWIYDCLEQLWYMFADDGMYLYDEETDTTSFYDEQSGKTYYYDDNAGKWKLMN